MKLIADSGSTKTDWCFVGDGAAAVRLRTRGINPFQQDAATISAIVEGGPAARASEADKVDEIYFYGAGCRAEMRPVLAEILSGHFPQARVVEINSDMLAAARALFADSEGMACILGTGSNSCLYDGCKIKENVPPLGYILGDEGSGAVLGRLFVNAVFKGRLSSSVRDRFLEDSGLSLAEIINKVYREPMANRFLASLSVFIHGYLDDGGVEALVMENFRDFFRRNIALYGRAGLPVGAVGSIAFYYKEQLAEAAAVEGFRLVRVLESPLEELVSFHARA